MSLLPRLGQRKDPGIKVLTITSSGSGGDLPPVTAVAQGRRKRGHDVMICGDPDLETMLGSTGVPNSSVPRGWEEHLKRTRKSVGAHAVITISYDQQNSEISSTPDNVRLRQALWCAQEETMRRWF